jgi:hypothetical protein
LRRTGHTSPFGLVRQVSVKHRSASYEFGSRTCMLTPVMPPPEMSDRSEPAGHPNDRAVVASQLRSSVLAMSEAERRELLGEIDRQLAELDARTAKQS